MKPSELDDFLHKNKMTGNELAAKLNVHYTTVSRWRNGRELIPKTVELALKWIEGEGRIGATGQNWNEGEHYENTIGANQMNFEEFKNNVEKWAEERGILQNGNVYTQTLKLISEFGELCDALAKGDKAALTDGIGDCAVVCVIISKMLGSKLIEIQVSSKDGRTPYAAGQTSALTGILQKLDLLFEQDKQYNCEWGILVLLEAIAYHSDLNFLECCALAWNEIKDRRGFLNEHGVFVKDA